MDCSPLFQRSTKPNPTNPKPNPINHNSTNLRPSNHNPKANYNPTNLKLNPVPNPNLRNSRPLE